MALASSRSLSALSSAQSERESRLLADELIGNRRNALLPDVATPPRPKRDLRTQLGRSATLEELGHVSSPSWTRTSEWSPTHPRGQTWTIPGGFLRDGGTLDGNPAMGTLKDYITVRSKGNVGAPFATRDRPIAGLDTADEGGAYTSYGTMMDHRSKHVRTRHGPNERFKNAAGPPITSWLHGFGEQKLRPPLYPVSSTEITRSAEDIWKTTGGKKGR